MDDSSSDESFYITQCSTRLESSRGEIDDCSFETTTLLDTENTRHRVTETSKEIQLQWPWPPVIYLKVSQDYISQTPVEIYEKTNGKACLSCALAHN